MSRNLVLQESETRSRRYSLFDVAGVIAREDNARSQHLTLVSPNIPTGTVLAGRVRLIDIISDVNSHVTRVTATPTRVTMKERFAKREIQDQKSQHFP